jgi:hypothetical protein
MRPFLITVCLLAASAAAQAQTNPCTQPLPAGVILSSASEVVAALPEHTAVVAGQPVVTEYSFGIFLPGVNPAAGGQPVTQVVIAKTSWVLKTGTPNCYGAKPSELLAIPVNADRTGAIKSRRGTATANVCTAPTCVESNWSALTNPFGLLAAPAVPTGARVTP